MTKQIRPVAVIHTDFPEPFGIPSQSVFCKELTGTVVLEPDFQKDGILKGLEQFSHLWLIWGFSESPDGENTVTVRPPRLGGNLSVGVFASRSPIRPNGLGLSVVKIEGIRRDTRYGMVIDVSGADLMDQTPIYDIKPYIPYSDSIPDASNGFACTESVSLTVEIPSYLEETIPETKRKALRSVLASDIRPGYQHDNAHVYHLSFAGFTISFQIKNDQTVVVTDIT
jgi:tRNA-Thr(GGU) m(6)t(6)A37 methyltransferase TsaA